MRIPPCRQLQMILEGDRVERDDGSGAEDECTPVASSVGPVSTHFLYSHVGSVGLNGGAVLCMQVSLMSSKEQFVDKLVTFLEQDRKASLRRNARASKS